MATAVLEAPSSAPASEQQTSIPRKRWTRAEYRQLIKDCYLEDGKVELVNGEIWEKMGQGRRHTIVVTWLLRALAPIFGMERIQCQSSLPTDEYSDPEPDLALLAQGLDQYIETDPTPADTLLVVEASNTTLRADLTTKQIMYARSGIPEYWVVDIPNQLLYVFREPTLDGYASEIILTPADEVHPLAAPASAVRVADLLPFERET
jgi:Uma2 family endonuclease